MQGQGGNEYLFSTADRDRGRGEDEKGKTALVAKPSYCMEFGVSIPSLYDIPYPY